MVKKEPKTMKGMGRKIITGDGRKNPETVNILINQYIENMCYKRRTLQTKEEGKIKFFLSFPPLLLNYDLRF